MANINIPEQQELSEDRIFDETIFKEHLRNKLTLLIDSVIHFFQFFTNSFTKTLDSREKNPFVRHPGHRAIKPFN